MAIPPLVRVAFTFLGNARGARIDVAEVENLLAQWRQVFGSPPHALERELTPYPSADLHAYALAILRFARERFGSNYHDAENLRSVRGQFLQAAGLFPSRAMLAAGGASESALRDTPAPSGAKRRSSRRAALAAATAADSGGASDARDDAATPDQPPAVELDARDSLGPLLPGWHDNGDEGATGPLGRIR